MKSLMVTIYFMVGAISSFAAYVPCGNPDEPGGIGRSVQGCNITCGDPGLEYYIPKAESPMLNLKIYYHIFQDGNNNFEESNADHIAYLEGIHANINSVILGGNGIEQICGDADLITEGCQENLTGDVSIDPRIRLELGPIQWYNNIDGTFNSGNLCGDYAYSTYVAPYSEFDDGLNIIFIDLPLSGFGGCGPGPYATINGGINRYVIGKPWKERSNLMHEIGHVLGLGHATWSCDQEYNCNNIPSTNSGCYNQLMGINSRQLYLSKNEIATMRRALLSNELAVNWLIDGVPEKENLVIDEPVIWNGGLTWYGDIEIKAGGQITLPAGAVLRMAEGSKIIVKRGAKLIVDGGTITSCSGEWQGIFVEGTGAKLNGQLLDPFAPTNANFAGTVIVHNGGVIEHAHDGITCRSTHVSWPKTKNYWGGLIYCDSANFENCNRAVEIFKYDVADDRSAFINTKFLNCKDGVTIWDSDGVEFSGCTFDNIEQTCIGPYNAELQIFGNTFRNSGFGIDFTASRLNIQESKIGEFGQIANQFENMEIGVRSVGMNNSEFLLIENNVFEGGTVGIRNDGHSYFRARRNDFNSTKFAVNTVSTGGGRKNFVALNFHDQNYICNYVRNENLSCFIEDNCFSSVKIGSLLKDPFDIFVEEGSINQDQGVPGGKSAGNCFSAPYTETIDTTTVTFFPNILNYNSAGFEYHVTSMTDQPCGTGNKVPGDVLNYDLFFDALNDNTAECGAEFAPPPPSGIICEDGGTENEIKNRILSIESEMGVLEQLPGSTVAYQLYLKQQCMEYNTVSLYEKLIQNEQFVEASNFFGQRNLFESKMLGYDALITKSDYSAARTYLNALLPNESEYQQLKFAKGQMLNFLEQGPEYEFNIADKNQLYQAGLIDHSSRGQIRAIYEFLSKEKMPDELPDPSKLSNDSSERKIKSSTDEILIYPNPLEGNNLYINSNKLMVESLSITNIQGARLKSFNGEQLTDKNISLKDIPSGIYWITIKLEGNVVKTEKLVRL